ncbi:hypothetical protein GCM10022226_74190 [Sphaerisporangium flaviroseum]|uniref:Uncharacterized protein n=1 Tax=Sphaerisporangium flaviroseum TaxID=509199 RepID=A0ABP7JCW6_9ACTN
MTTAQILLSVVLGFIVNECCDAAPWLARKLVQWSARLKYGASARAEVRAEELTALIDTRPGKLLKLMSAVLFLVGASTTCAHRIMLFLQLRVTIALRPEVNVDDLERLELLEGLKRLEPRELERRELQRRMQINAERAVATDLLSHGVDSLPEHVIVMDHAKWDEFRKTVDWDELRLQTAESVWIQLR